MSQNSKADTLPRKALVTGGATGIGWAICQRFAASGIVCVIADINEKAAQERAQTLGPGHVAIGVDLSDLAQAAGLVARAAQVVGGLDIVVNNAGITDTSGRRVGEIPIADFERLVAVNLSSVDAICKASQEVLQAGGVVVNLASGAAYRPLALRGAYSATKAAILTLTKNYNTSAAKLGQRVCAVAPGYVRTELVESLIANGRLDAEAAAATVPLGRLGDPDDIARAVAFLASSEGGPLAGECLSVDGGTIISGGRPLASDARQSEQPGDGPIIIIGGGPSASAISQTLAPHHAVKQIETHVELADGPTPSAIIDMTPLSYRDVPGAMSHLHALAQEIENLEPGQPFSLLLVTAERDAPTAAAVGMLSQVLALEWAPRGHRVNTVVWSSENLDGLGRLAGWISSEQAGYVTGQVITAKAPQPN